MSASSNAQNDEHGLPIRVLLVDDHELFRLGLRQLLEAAGFAVADAATAQAALRCAQGAPDVVVIGVNRPAACRADSVRVFIDATSSAAVIVLALVLDEAHIVRAVQAGATGYLLKDADLTRLVAGIRDAARGNSALSPLVARTLIDRLRHAPEPAVPAAPGGLSERELEVLALLASGCDNTEIGDRLFVSRSTVKNHVSRVLEKLQVANRVQAATYAVRSGLV
jgi:DNA-binding NarL/FixJ family response regulator